MEGYNIMADKLYTDDVRSRIPGLAKNAVINGDASVAQRGATVSIGSGVDYGLDCWKTFITSTAVFDMNQYVGGPTFAQSGYKSAYSLEMDVTTADVSLAAGAYTILSQPIEGYRLSPFIGNTVTLSFWLMATKTGATCLKLIAYGEGKEIMKEFTISQSLTWEKHTWTFELDPSLAFNQNSEAGLGINFSLGAGATYQGAATDVWTDFAYQCTANQVNHMDNTANVFRLSQVQLEIGSEATVFEGRDFETELALCQRYYEKSYNQGNDPGTATGTGITMASGAAIGVTTRAAILNGRFAVNKRATPSVSVWDSLGAAGKCNLYNNSGTTYTVSSIAGEGQGVVGNYLTTSSAMTGDAVLFHWTADASM